jgi:hypothetical protein
MEYWMIQAIISLIEAGAIIGGIAAILKWSAFVPQKEFKRQTAICDRRFEEMAAESRSVKAILKRINKHLREIEAEMDRRFDVLDEKYDKRVSTIEDKIKKRGEK